jgi:AraC-like DNA-binding protein
MLMKGYRPIHLQHLGLRAPGLEMLALRLNHHMPEPVWTTHSHDHDQVLVFLEGRGNHQLGERLHACRAGTVIHVPKGTPHAYTRVMERAPLVLVLDIDLEITRYTVHPCAQMSTSDLTKVLTILTGLLTNPSTMQKEFRLAVAGQVFALLDRVLLTAGWLKFYNRFAADRSPALVQFTERLITRMDGPTVTLIDIATRAGYTVAALNKKLKTEAGLTLGQLRSRLRLQRARLLLRQGHSMAIVARRIHLPDQNYFSRWFRQQTGMTPTQWKTSSTDVVGF